MRAPWLSVALLALVGCAAPTPKPTEQPLAAVTYFPTPARPPTRTPIPSPTPTATPQPSPTPVPSPTPTLLPATPTPKPQATPTLALIPLSAPTPSATPLPTAPPTPAPPPTAEASCPRLPATYALVTFIGAPYKDNALTDYNPDLRLSVLGLEPTDAPSVLVDYQGGPPDDSPRLSQILRTTLPVLGRTYLRYEWAWDHAGPPPYGRRTVLNRDWPAAALELLTPVGAWVYPPARNTPIDGEGSVAMVLFASEREVALGYTRSDSVEAGYVIYVLNLCVSPELVALYRAQLAGGRRATGHLPAVRADQPIGVSFGSIIVAVRDRGAFLDPRARADWW